MESEFAKGVLTWLNQTGYPLELRVGRKLRLASWKVNYGRRYTDPTTGKRRELDIHAVVGAVNPKTASVFCSLCIECKSSKDKPWVALDTGAVVGPNPYPDLALGSLSEMVVINAGNERIGLPNLFPAETPRVGGIVQAHGAKDDSAPTAPYSALMQAVSAASALDAEYCETAVDVSGNLATAGFFLPVVVFDGRLLKYSIDTDLKESLAEVDLVLVSVPGGVEQADALVPVFSAQAFEARLAAFQRELHSFAIAMLPHADVIRAALQINALPNSETG